MKRLTTVLFAFAFAAVTHSLLAHDPRTHVWVAQQVLNDVVPDGKVTIDGFEYKVPEEIVQALIVCPGSYRMGHVGPDAHPDLVAGQSYLHPGTGGGGWWADDWGKWLQDQAKQDGSKEAIAYSRGYWGHLAGDVIAHSYVNTYAGDFWLLSDEQEVELRHFILEHYVGDRTPPLRDHLNAPVGEYKDILVPPSEFLAKNLILHDTSADQYMKVPGYGAHLISIWRLRKSVRDTRELVERFEAPLNDKLDQLDKLQDDADKLLVETIQKLEALNPGLEPLIKQVELLRKAVEAQKVLNAPIEAAASDLEKKVLKAADEVSAAEASIREAERQLESLVSREIPKIDRAVSDFQEEVDRWESKLADAKKLVSAIDATIGPLAREVDRLESRLSRLVRHVPGLSGAIDKLDQARKELGTAEENVRTAVDNIANFANKVLQQKQLLQRKVQERVNLEAALDLHRKARETANAALEVARNEVGNLSEQLQAARDALRERLSPLTDAETQLSELKRQLEQLEDLRKELEAKINDLARQLLHATHLRQGLFLDPNCVSKILSNWEKDIEKAASAYVDATTAVLLSTMTPGGDHMRPLTEWFECWAPVLTGVPSAVTTETCKATAYLRDFANALKALPEEQVRRIPIVDDLFVKIEVLKKDLENRLIDVAIDLSDHIFGEEVTKFIATIGKHYTDEDLHNTYSTDTSGKQLLVISDMPDRIKRDLGMDNGWPNQYFNEALFSMAQHSVTMAKLTLLGPEAFSQMAKNYGLTEDTVFANESTVPENRNSLYPNEATFVNVLYRAVRSIDGNQQWRGYSLPYIRRVENRDTVKFGYCHSESDPSVGFRMWVDEGNRKNVFPKVFPGGLKLASLAPGIAEFVPDYVKDMEDGVVRETIDGQEVVRSGVFSCVSGDSGVPQTIERKPIRDAAARTALEAERRTQILDVPSVHLYERVDGLSREQVLAAMREEIRTELRETIRAEVFAELRKVQQWEGAFAEKQIESRKTGKFLLVAIEGDQVAGRFAFDELLKDEFHAKLLEPFVLLTLNLKDPNSQLLLRRRGGQRLPVLLLLSPSGDIVCQRQGVVSYEDWAETLIQFGRRSRMR